MDNTTPKTYSIIAVVLILALGVAGYLVFNTFLPNYNQAKNSLAIAQANGASLKKALDGVQTFLTNYKAQTANTNRVALALPAGSPDMPNFISSLSGLASASGVALSNFQISPASSTTGDAAEFTIQREDFGVSASGTFASMKDFLRQVETHLRLIDIYNVSISSTTEQTTGDGESLLQFDIKIHTYFQQ